MTTVLYAGRHLMLVASDGWEYVRRSTASAVVGIVAVTPVGELLLVEQRRIPVAATVIELPAGLVGDEQADEDLLAAANRELEEETGWRARSCRVLSRSPSSAGLTSELITLVRATDLERCGHGGGVAGEAITVHRVALAEVPDILAARERAGMLIDSKIHAGLWWLGWEDRH